VPGNAQLLEPHHLIWGSNDNTDNYMYFASAARHWFKLFSLKDAAKDLADHLQRLQDSPGVEQINIAGLSMGGATLVLALDRLKRKGVDVSKIKKVYIFNTFSSLSAVIADILQEFKVTFTLCLMFCMHLGFTMLVGAPMYFINLAILYILSNSNFILDCLSATVPHNEGGKRFYIDSELVAIMLTTLSVLLLKSSVVGSALLMYQCAILLLPYILLYNTMLIAKAVTWLMDSDIDVRAAYDNILKDPSYNLSVFQAGGDSLLARGVRLAPEEQLNFCRENHGCMPSDYSRDWSTFSV
jgi:hypothetical protein